MSDFNDANSNAILVTYNNTEPTGGDSVNGNLNLFYNVRQFCSSLLL